MLDKSKVKVATNFGAKVSSKKTGSSNVNVILVAIVVVLSVLQLYQFFKGGSSAGDSSSLYSDSEVVAKVDGKPVYAGEVINLIKTLTAPTDKQINISDLDENTRTAMVREIAAQRLMLKEAKSNGVKEDKEIQRKVVDLRNKLLLDAYIEKNVAKDISEDKVKSRYAEVEQGLKGKFQIKIGHILVKSEADAEKAGALLKKGEAFAKVAKEMSLDASSRDRGGDLGVALSGTSLDPDFEKAALALKNGEISAPVKTKFGWHIIKLDEKKNVIVPAFDVLKPRIEQDLRAEALKSYADKLLETAKIDMVALKDDKKEDKSSASQDDKAQDLKKSQENTEVKQDSKADSANKEDKKEVKKQDVKSKSQTKDSKEKKSN